jgi:hypothetical protein
MRRNDMPRYVVDTVVTFADGRQLDADSFQEAVDWVHHHWDQSRAEFTQFFLDEVYEFDKEGRRHKVALYRYGKQVWPLTKTEE